MSQITLDKAVIPGDYLIKLLRECHECAKPTVNLDTLDNVKYNKIIKYNTFMLTNSMFAVP